MAVIEFRNPRGQGQDNQPFDTPDWEEGSSEYGEYGEPEEAYSIQEDRNPRGSLDYDDTADRRRRRSLLRTVGVTALGILAAVVLGLLIRDRTYSRASFNNVADYEALDAATYCNLDGCILAYSRDGASCMDDSGKKIWNLTYEMQQPIISIDGGVAAIGDYNGSIIYLVNKEKTLNTVNTNMPIRALCVSESGEVAAVLDDTDVLVWWSHILQDAIPDALAFKIVQRVQKGMGFVPLHSAHKSKPFMYLLGTSGCLKWREDDFCRVWTAAPGHPIAQGSPESFELEEEEMYGEPFDIPRPDDNIFISWYSGGELFRSGCTWTRGYGRIFYFQPGHETSPNYHNPYVQRLIRQGIRWAAPRTWRENFDCPNILDAPEARRKRGEQADGQPTL